MDRIATVVIDLETVSFVVRDITGEIFPFSFPASRYDSVLDVLRDASRLRGTIDRAYVGGAWISGHQGQKPSGMNWPAFQIGEIPHNVCNDVKLTSDTDATLAMLRLVQGEVTAHEAQLNRGCGQQAS